MSEAKSRSYKKHVSTILRIGIALVALYFVFRGEDLGQVGKTFLGINWFVFGGAFLLYIFCNCIFVFRWGLLLKAQEIHISYFSALKLHFLGLFYNNCLPGSIGGDLLRAWYVTHHTDKKIEAALSVFVDRAIGFGCTIILAAFFYWLILNGQSSEGLDISRGMSEGNGSIIYVKWLLIIFFIAAFILMILLSANLRGRSMLKRAYSVVCQKGVILFKKLLTAVKLYCSKPFTLMFAVFLTFFIQLLAIFSFWLICWERGIGVELKYYFAFFPVSWVVGSLPISVGGVGIMEGSLKMLFSKVPGILKGQSVMPGLIQRGILLLISIPGLIIHIKGTHLPVDKEEFLVDSEPELD
ncbi:MAG: flippase-like domain-containing protein [Sedimentisphaerales bacterium]|nr:flippase-like domain-containing protein [Sedimentisphaerales bacterium]